VTKLEQAVDRS